MAISILWIDGFDEIGNINQKYKPAPEADPQNRSTYTSRTGKTAPFGYGRFYAVYNGYLSKTLPSPPYSTLFSAFHMCAATYSSVFSNRNVLFEFWKDSDAAPQCHIALTVNKFTAKFSAILVRGSTDLYTWLTPIRLGQWHHVSIRALIDDTVGQVTLAVDGQDLGTFTGDTKYLSSSGVDRFRLRYTVAGEYFFVDNWIVATGLPTDPLLPPARVYGSAVPNANVEVSWTPSAGTNWECVDEIPHNSDVDYNSTETLGNQDVFSHATIPNLGTDVLAVKVNCISRVYPSVQKVQPLVRVSGTDYYGTAQYQTNSYFSYGHIWQNNPATALPWDPTDAQSAGFGYRRQ